MIWGYAVSRRGRRIVFLLLIIFASWSLLYLGEDYQINWHQLNLAQSLISPSSPPETFNEAPNVQEAIHVSPWAQEDECGRGHWVPKPLYKTYEQYRAMNRHSNGFVWPGCNVFNDSGIEDEGLKKTLQGQRLVELANWEWQPSRGALVSFDPVDFVVRLVQSPGGLVMFGDSLSRQHHDNLFLYLSQKGIYHDGYPPNPNYNHTTHHVLRPGSPMTKVILERSGVPPSRLKRPFFTFVEDHMILPPEDIMRISNAPEEYEWPFSEKVHPYVLGLPDLLAELAKPEPGEEETVQKDTIFLFNTGPHWSRGRLPIPRSTYEQEKEDISAVYGRMIDLITTRLKPISRALIFYRSTSPPHPQCETHTSPYPDLRSAQVGEANLFEKLVEGLDLNWRRIKGRWDWDLFETYNGFWKEKVKMLAEESVKENRRQRWHFLDIWGMTLQRPEAHFEPGKDCLHYCVATIYPEWTQQLYHRLFLLGEVRAPQET